MNDIWRIYRVEPDLYVAYRNEHLYHYMTSRQLEMDARFFRDYADLMRELNQTGQATREFGRSSICQFNPFPD
jgi:endo-1,4-beta-mannosidase